MRQAAEFRSPTVRMSCGPVGPAAAVFDLRTQLTASYATTGAEMMLQLVPGRTKVDQVDQPHR